jgi:hypothetical protein
MLPVLIMPLCPVLGTIRDEVVKIPTFFEIVKNIFHHDEYFH